jgi:hypothetical protein
MAVQRRRCDAATPPHPLRHPVSNGPHAVDDVAGVLAGDVRASAKAEIEISCGARQPSPQERGSPIMGTQRGHAVAVQRWKHNRPTFLPHAEAERGTGAEQVEISALFLPFLSGRFPIRR